MEYYLAIRKNGVHAITWIKFENIKILKKFVWFHSYNILEIQTKYSERKQMTVSQGKIEGKRSVLQEGLW